MSTFFEIRGFIFRKTFVYIVMVWYVLHGGARGGIVVKALGYKPAGRGLIWIFQWHNPSGRTMALGSTQPLTEMSTRCISWG